MGQSELSSNRGQNEKFDPKRLGDVPAEPVSMIVAITGAAGFVGRNLTPALAAGGRKVRALVFTGEGLKALTSWRRVSRARAECELGFRPRPLEETVKDTVGWLRVTGGLDRWRNRRNFCA